VSVRKIKFESEDWPIRGSFRISRGAKSVAEVVVVEITEGAFRGRGECVPYGRYGETRKSVLHDISDIADDIVAGLDRGDLQNKMSAGAARNAIDCALIDLEAKKTGRRAYELLGIPEPRPLKTAFTLSLDSPECMARAAANAETQGYGLLKLKVAGTGDLDRVRAVRSAAPAARLIVDANEGWNLNDLTELAPALAQLGVALIEQPLPVGEDEALHKFVSKVPLCADESCHTRGELDRIIKLYQAVNVKLDKAGGLTEALALLQAARESGLSVIVGCMVATSLAMAPAMLLGSNAAYVDLDGPLLLERDRMPGLTYQRDLVYPPEAALWG
jgi:L-alanine-DL-glutamate epimerase-like enolase superfamily enzyme